MNRLIAAALLAVALIVPSSAALATDVEADAVGAVVTAWSEEPDTQNNTAFLEELILLFPDASPECRSYIDLVFAALAIYDASNDLAPDVQIGQETFTNIVSKEAGLAYACRIAL